MAHHEAPCATIEQLTRVHTTEHPGQVEALAPEQGFVPIDAETFMNPGTWEAALRAAGGAVHAVELVLVGETDGAFCALRPPGHHAEPAKVMGFCFFNNVAVGAAHAIKAFGLERIAIVDFDVHFGNGTSAMFRDHPQVLVCSIYEHPLFPGVNPPTIPGAEINCPLAEGSGADEFRRAIDAHIRPELDAFKPELLLLSAGFDAVSGDLLGGLRLAPEDFGWITRALLEASANDARRGVVSVLEGGYNLTRLGPSAVAHVAALRDGLS